MPRRYRSSGRFSRRIKTVKYSNETFNFADQWSYDASTQVEASVIAPIDQQGTRKCKNFELTMAGTNFFHPSSGQNDPAREYLYPVTWALVYVPQGTKASKVQFGSAEAPASTYEPNQNVIMAGVWPGGLTAPYKVKTRLARNLNSGDSICLILATPPADDLQGCFKNIVCQLNYAISF